MSRILVAALAVVFVVAGCTSGWSEEESSELVEHCRTLLENPQQPGSPQCETTVEILRDDLRCPVDVAYRFLEETADLQYEAARAIVSTECEVPPTGRSIVPDD